jgi:putative transposase
MSPDTVHHGRAGALTARRAITLNDAFLTHPNRFKGIAPQPPKLPNAAWINPPKKDTAQPTITIDCSLNS